MRRASIDHTFEPSTHEEAIAAAVIVHDCDLTWSNVPLLDYCRVARGDGLSNPLINSMFTNDRHVLQPSFSFNPSLPITAYTPGSLEAMASRIGLASMTTDLYYNELTMDALTDTFRLGLHPRLSTLDSHLGSVNFDEEPEFQPICYGSYSSNMVVYELEELCQLFENNHNFNNPAGGRFDIQAIQRLKLICRTGNRFNAHFSLWGRLAAAIETVEQLEGSDEEEVGAFVRRYHASNEDQKGSMRNVMKQLQEAALYMRSWRGDPQPWPIEHAPPDYNQDAVDQRVADALHNMNTTTEQDTANIFNGGDELQQLLQLPLFTYNDGKYVRSRNSESGLTISGRLEIVENGNNHDNSQSCIRISSNILMTTSYRYLSLMGDKPPYRLENLRHIV